MGNFPWWLLRGTGRLTLQAVVVALASAAVAACTPYLKSGPVTASHTYRVAADFRTGAFDRFYNLYIPSGFTEGRPAPLLIVVHGAFDTADGMARFTRFSELADREGFFVIYPEGIGLFGYLQHWNAGHCCGKAAQEGIDDVGFVARAIADIRERFAVSRVFMVGFSNGGMFVHRFAAERGVLLDGAAALAASIGSRVGDDPAPWQLPPPAVPVAMVMIHGTADTDVPYDGGASDRGDGARVYRSVADSAAFWRRANGCSDRETSTSMREGALVETRWGDCRSGKPVVQVTLQDWEHIWPGPYFTAELAGTHPMKDFDAAALVWSFFSNLP
ncbi:MAG: PHB depolymerase family esterase [Pseudomonadota bacterium]